MHCTAAAKESVWSATAGTRNACASPSPTRTTFWRCHRKSRSQHAPANWTCLACAVHSGPRRPFNSIWNWTMSGLRTTWSIANSKSTATSSVYVGRHRRPIRPSWPWQSPSSDRKRLSSSSTWTCTKMASSVASPSSKFSSTSRNTISKKTRGGPMMVTFFN